MRVLQIVAAPSKKYQLSGVNGPERRASNLISHWKEFGINPIIAYPKRGKLFHNFEFSGVPIVDFEINSKYDFFAIFKCLKIIKDHSVDLMHTQGPASLDLIATLAAKMANIPIVVTRPYMIKDDLTFSTFKKIVYEFMDRVTLFFASTMVAVMESGKRDLIDIYKVPENRVKLIYNGVKLKKFNPRQHKPIEVNGKIIKIGMAAQFTSVKGWPDFLKTLALLIKEGKNVQGILIGDGPEIDNIKKLSEQLGIDDKVEFKGHVETVSSELYDLDIFFFPSYREGLSVAIIEALSMGLPIVASDVGGIKEQVFENENGFVCPVGEIASYQEKLLRLIDNSDLRVAFSKRSRQIAEERFSEDRMLKEHVALYQSQLEF